MKFIVPVLLQNVKGQLQLRAENLGRRVAAVEFEWERRNALAVALSTDDNRAEINSIRQQFFALVDFRQRYEQKFSHRQ
jgi:hypothetical protein